MELTSSDGKEREEEACEEYAPESERGRRTEWLQKRNASKTSAAVLILPVYTLGTAATADGNMLNALWQIFALYFHQLNKKDR